MSILEESQATQEGLPAAVCHLRDDALGQQEHMGNIFIGIAGMIGAGKSTLATALGEHMGIQTYYEPVQDNEYLQDF